MIITVTGCTSLRREQALADLATCDNCDKSGEPFTFVLPVTFFGETKDTTFERRAHSEACRQAIIKRTHSAMEAASSEE